MKISAKVKPGEVYTTFHSARVFLNQITTSQVDRYTKTPEYKITAVRVEKGDRSEKGRTSRPWPAVFGVAERASVSERFTKAWRRALQSVATEGFRYADGFPSAETTHPCPPPIPRRPPQTPAAGAA